MKLNFIEALKKCGYSKERVRSKTVDAKNFPDIKDRVKIYRPIWKTMSPPYPLKFIWVTSQNIPMGNIGNNQSMPLLMEVPDFIANDWEIYKE